MNPRLIVFLIASLLAVGSVVVYTKNNIDPKESEGQKQELSNFGNPEAGKTQDENPFRIKVTQSPVPSQAQAMQNVTELKIEDVTEGTGEPVKSGDTAEVHYTGTFLDGKKFDSSHDRNQTFSFSVGAGEVIPGWDLGLIGMKAGGKRKLLIPSDLAYGPMGSGPIPPNTPLAFEVELISIK